MKYRTAVAKHDANPRSGPFKRMGTKRLEQALDVSPRNCRADGVFKNRLERFSMLRGQTHGVNLRHWSLFRLGVSAGGSADKSEVS